MGIGRTHTSCTFSVQNLQQDYTPIWIYKGNNTHVQGGMSQPDPFGFIVQTRIIMHVLTIFIRALEMTCTNKALEGQSKIVLDIHGLVVHQGCPSHIMSMPSIERPYTSMTQRASQTKCCC